MVLPCSCCPPSPSLSSPVCPGMPVKAWSPSWEEAEGGVIVVSLNLLLWGVLWALFGQAAGPLSAPFYVIMLSLAGHAIGVLVGALTPFPPMYGMLLMPAIVSNLGLDELEVLDHVRGDIAALIVFASMGVFVARAGIDVELSQLQSSSGLVLALAFLPLLSEVAVVTLVATYVLDISLRWAFLLATLTSPMSPLVVMWTALQLRRADLGTPTAVCSLLLVVCALDWAAGLCLMGVALKCAVQTESWSTIASGLTELISGILIGSVIGFFSIYVPNEHNVHATFYRVEMLLAVNVCFVVLFHYFLGMPAIGYLSAFTTACVASNGWKTLSMDSKKARYSNREIPRRYKRL
ncbi:uncharacterized protein LOC113217359 [Frankliniella occidentalis]|uniref:Uncharacterized protein LOC113217359 n=1 Tax=Frankliniella occidentalis TaxID=133901 RepID=A0A6J1THN6_FRAOC|nr:uncharacterized protein LOC113217359 [Frankliniella occidentalis]